MNELPSDLYDRCRVVLLQCDEFQNDDTLRAVLGMSQLRDYTPKILEAKSPEQRVDFCLRFLRNRRLNGEPALALLLETLSYRYPGGDDIHIALKRLAQDVHFVLSEANARLGQTPSTVNSVASMDNSLQDMSSPQNAPSVDVGIVFALGEEFRELFKEFKKEYVSVYDRDTYRDYYKFQVPAESSVSSYQCIATFAGDMGLLKMGLATEQLINRWRPRILVILGIAGALDDDVRLGDVVVANQVNIYLENSKAVPTPDSGGYSFLLSPESYRSSPNLLSATQNFEFRHPKLYLDWQTHCAQELEHLLPSTKRVKMISAGQLYEQPHIHFGHLASGPSVGASIAFKNWLKEQDRKYLALEMETGGFLTAAHERVYPGTLVLRAISDHGDERKKQLDKTSKGVFRRYALHNAIRLLWSLFETDILRR